MRACIVREPCVKWDADISEVNPWQLDYQSQNPFWGGLGVVFKRLPKKSFFDVLLGECYPGISLCLNCFWFSKSETCVVFFQPPEFYRSLGHGPKGGRACCLKYLGDPSQIQSGGGRCPFSVVRFPKKGTLKIQGSLYLSSWRL